MVEEIKMLHVLYFYYNTSSSHFHFIVKDGLTPSNKFIYFTKLDLTI